MNRWLEALLFGLGSLACVGAGWAIVYVGAEWTEAALVLAGVLQTGGIAALAYLAGRRSSILGLIAVVAFPLVVQFGLVLASRL